MSSERRNTPERRASEPRYKAREPMSQERIDTARAYVSTQVCYHFLAILFEDRRPMDRELSTFFRENKRFGSHDRRLISESIFSLTRWWGWVRKLVPSPDMEQWATLSRERIMQSPRWFLPLLAARMLDGQHTEGPMAFWAKANRIDTQNVKWGDLNLKDKAQALSDLFKINVMSPSALFPPFFAQELPEGTDLSSMQEQLQKRPPIWLRIQHPNHVEVLNSLRSDGITVEQHPIISEALKIEHTRVNLHETNAFQMGWIEIQDIASQCVGKVSGARAGERWLDYCAGAGGKTLQLASMMHNKGTIVAVDKRNWKLDDLRKRAKRAGFHNILIKDSDGDYPKEKANAFDGVLVDAPCSCTGTWRRNPDARWTTEQEEIMTLVELQKEIIKRAAKSVKSGGVLVYATCSFSIHENEEVAKWVTETLPEFAPLPFTHPFSQTICQNGMLRIMPSEENSDAMFIAKFQKK